MKWNCDLIQDLLPLYEEDLCSPGSRLAVEEHLCECETCRRLTVPLPIAEQVDTAASDRAVKKSMRKVKRRWLASLAAAVLAVPLLLLSINQYRGSGLCFTNLDDIYTAWQFVHALETQNWEKAAQMHEYSRDYASILEALSQDPADWGSTFTLCDLAGHAYAASGYLDRAGLIPATAEALYGCLYNRSCTAMVPLALWEELMAMDPAAFDQNGWEYWLNGERYGKISTPWGTFVVSEGRGYDTAYDYAVYFDLIPAAIYEAAKPALEEEALRLYTTTHNDIGWVAELTEDAFTDEMIRRYTADLSALEGEVTFDCTGYRSCCVYGSGEDGISWYVIFALTVTQNGKTIDTEIHISVSDGKIDVAGTSHKPGIPWLDAIDRALYPSAHSGY